MVKAHPLDLIDAAAAGGFDFCGIRLVAPRPGDPLVDVLGEPQIIREIGARLKNSGVRLLDIEAIWISPTTDVETLRHPLEVGAELGAQYVLVVGFDEERERLLERFSRICDIAKPLGLIVMIEFITYCSIKTIGEAARLVADSGRENAGVLIDTLQFFRSGASPSELDDYEPSLFRYMQLCDGRSTPPQTLDERRNEARRDRLLPGQGELPVANLLARLPSTIPLSVEAPTRDLYGLPFREQGRIAGEVTRRFLATLGR